MGLAGFTRDAEGGERREEWSFASTNWQGMVDGGFTYALGPNLQLDLGCDVGVTDSAPDFHPFVGLSVRR